MKWEKFTLEEICNHITSGGTPLSSRTDYYVPSVIPWLKTKEVNYCRIYDTETKISAKGLVNSSAKLIRENSVIIAMYGQGGTAGRVAINKIPLCTNQACCNLLINKSKANYEYVYYYLATQYDKLVSLKNGGAQPNLNAKKIRNFEIELPPLAVQNRIAEILSRYDDLIENYQRQISLLEEAAQRLYKEWFVDLHFPGYENTPIVDGVPEGWEKKTANSIYDVTIGKTPPRSEKHWFNSPDGVSWASISDMKATTFISDTIENLSSQAVERFNIKVVPKNTILLSFKLTVGRVVISSTALCTNEAIAHFPIKEDFLREYTYLYLRNFNYDSLGNTSSISKAVNSTIVKNMPIVLPAKDILVKFSSLTKPLFDRIENLTFQIKNLTEARDRLLPKLMNGEIEV